MRNLIRCWCFNRNRGSNIANSNFLAQGIKALGLAVSTGPKNLLSYGNKVNSPAPPNKLGAGKNLSSTLSIFNSNRLV